MSLRLEIPNEDYKEKIMEYREEFIKYGGEMDGTSGLLDFESFEEWYEKLLRYSKEETVARGKVPSTTYLAFDEEDRVIGMISVRHRLNENLIISGGHIGYSVRPLERRKGFAKIILGLALEKCKEKNMDKVLITCSKENSGSAKTIISNGGVLENEIIDESNNRVVQRYWINL